MVRIRLTVEIPDRNSNGKFKVLYRNELTFHDDVNIPFNDLYKALRILYPQTDAFINFQTMI